MPTFNLREHPRKKTAEGGPVVLEYITVGEGASIAHRPATDADRALYAREYKAFRAGKQADVPAHAPPAPAPYFELRPFKGDAAHPKGLVEYVCVPTGKDVVHRLATDEDRRVHFVAYEAFKSKSVPVATSAAPVLLASAPVPEDTGPVAVDPALLAKSAETDDEAKPKKKKK